MNAQPQILNPQPRQVLVRGVNWLSDAVMTTPALLQLRKRFLKAHVALLSPRKMHDVWRQHPAIDEVIAIEAGEGLFSVGHKLHEKQFALALVVEAVVEGLKRHGRVTVQRFNDLTFQRTQSACRVKGEPLPLKLRRPVATRLP